MHLEYQKVMQYIKRVKTLDISYKMLNDVGMASTRPLSLNKYNGSELSNAAAIRPFRNITWPTSVSRHDNTLKGSKIHRYNDIRETAETRFSPSSSSSENRHNSKSA